MCWFFHTKILRTIFMRNSFRHFHNLLVIARKTSTNYVCYALPISRKIVLKYSICGKLTLWNCFNTDGLATKLPLTWVVRASWSGGVYIAHVWAPTFALPWWSMTCTCWIDWGGKLATPSMLQKAHSLSCHRSQYDLLKYISDPTGRS